MSVPARRLWLRAGHLKDAGDPRTVVETLIAKYFASRAAVQAAADTVQIHGANGFGSDYPVQRYYRDCKVAEIIEGSSQILEIDHRQRGLRSVRECGMSKRPTASEIEIEQEAAAQWVKCIVWDLDNTLWDGVLLEDQNVRLRPEVPSILRTLDERGILHSIASRNDHALAMGKLNNSGWPTISSGRRSTGTPSLTR